MVAYSHNAIAGGRANYVRALALGAAPMRALVLVPLASSMGSLGTYVTIARLGGTLVLLDRFAPDAALRSIARHRPTHVFAVPTMLRRIVARPRPSRGDVASLRAVVASGAALDAATRSACERDLRCTVIEVYGAADGVNCHTAAWRGPRPSGIVGRPDPRVAAIRVVDERGRPAPAGTAGEIWARGPMTPLCHVNAPELDLAQRAPGGWVRAGDRGVLGADGALRLVGRTRQIVVRGGLNVSLAEVESQLLAHPAVVDAACVGIEDDDLGERLCACVVLSGDAPELALDELDAFLAEERGLERGKLPDALLVLDELPLGATGKACRRTLSALAARADQRSARRPCTK